MLANFNADLSIDIFAKYSKELIDLSNNAININNVNIIKWNKILKQINTQQKYLLTLEDDYIKINANIDKKILQEFIPWRKGPFKFNNQTINSEWNGNIKWQRLIKHINLTNKIVLDVGSGNGYFSYKMSIAGAKTVLALEPFLLFNYQFQIIKKLSQTNVITLPLKLESIPNMAIFDIVFSMGVLYHHKSPINHLLKLKKMLNKNGVLLLETLIVDGEKGYSLMPKERYAMMRNIWFIPTIKTLKSWLYRCGFKEIKIIDITITTPVEQKATAWLGVNNKSLIDFLKDNKTIEGYQRPTRAMLLCKL